MDWLVYGCRTDHAAEVVEVIWRRGDGLAALVDNLPDPPALDWAGEVAVLSADEVDDRLARLATAIPQTTPGHRYAVAQDAIARGCADFPPLVDPTAVVGHTTRMARGTFVGAGSVVAALSTLGEFAIVNRSVSVGHHAQVGDYASLGPGCVLAGNVRIGRGAFIGAGAVCAPGISIGSNATVGAGAVVVRDVAEGDLVVGNPARVLRSGTVGFQGVGVP